ncbi:tetratricopeptide repeat protein [Streptomyces sulphureus]|uniref:tetratricopeptide repeat protein n=1 Tax=Streptomyces sulphureus TaxID=47758 RepID=UPI000364686A|nr:tetratricopeptide repeat protein [Streptomyces sulphureus]
MADRTEHPCGPRGLLGRGRELAALQADLGRAGLHTLAGRPAPYARVLLVAGRPGSGRTSLAEEFASRVASGYPGGVLRTGLTGPRGTALPAGDAARRLLAAAGAPPLPAPADDDELTEALRTRCTERPAVLLLDDVVDSEQVLELLPESRRCLVLAVAQGPLTGVPDVRPCALGGLDRASSVRLLAHRAGATPRVTVDPRGAESLAQECADLPAALLLVGGWLRAHPKASVVDALGRLTAAPCDDRPLEPHADPLARAWRLVRSALTPRALRLAPLLALAPDGAADVQTAAALAGCDAAAAAEALTELREFGLLRARDDGWFALPGCLAPLLRAELEAGRPADAVLATARMGERTVRRLVACRAAAEPSGSPARRKAAALPAPLRFPSAPAAAEWLSAHREWLLASARLAADTGAPERLPAEEDAPCAPGKRETSGELDNLARRLTTSLGRALELHLPPAEAACDLYRLSELLLRLADRGALHRERAAALLALADHDTADGRLPRALHRYRTALDAAREAGDGEAVGAVLEQLGACYAQIDDWARAADWYARALAHRQTRGEHLHVAALHTSIARAHGRTGRWDEALREWRAAASGFRRLREPPSQARALGEAARIQMAAGRPQDAARNCRQALRAVRGGEEPQLSSELLVLLAAACRALGETESAREHEAAARLAYDGRADPDVPGAQSEAEPSVDAAHPSQAEGVLPEPPAPAGPETASGAGDAQPQEPGEPSIPWPTEVEAEAPVESRGERLDGARKVAGDPVQRSTSHS